MLKLAAQYLYKLYALVRRVLPAALLMLLACDPPRVEVQEAPLNHHTRLDRLPLTPAQRPDAIAVPDLTRGLYRTGADVIISEGLPAGMPETIGSLPQSTCFWLGNDGAQKEGWRMHWESQYALPDDALDKLDLTDEVRHLALCRLNDPVTRLSPRPRDGSTQVVDYAGADIGIYGGSFEHNFTDPYRILDDIHLLYADFSVHPTTADTFNQCRIATIAGASYGLSDPALDYTGVSLDQRVSHCSGPFGNVIFPTEDLLVRFTYRPEEDQEIHYHYDFSTALKIAEPEERLARQMQPQGNGWAWATPQQGTTATNVHWEENFSRRIKVDRVRFFVGNAEPRRYLDLGQSQLCISDPVPGPGCRWRCDADNVDGASVYELRPDGFGGPGCRLAAGPGFAPDLPPVTPTFAKDNLCDTRDPGCMPVLQPLNWSVSSANVNGPLYVEFEVSPVFEGMALTAEPVGTDMGAARVGRTLQANFEVRNTGGVPIEIDVLGWRQHAESALSASVAAIGDAQPLPLPIRVGESGIEIVDEIPAITGVDMMSGDGFSAYSVSQPDHNLQSIGEHPVEVDGRFVFRQAPEVELADPALSSSDYPAAAMTYVRKPLPLTLQPDQAVTILLNLSADRYRGINGGNEHLGWWRVEASNVFDPLERMSAEIPVTMHTLLGPALQVFPPALSLPLGNTQHPDRHRATLLLTNQGDQPLQMLNIKLTDRDAGQFSLVSPPGLPLSLAAGAGQLLEIQYQGNCDQNAWRGHRAVLELETTSMTRQIRLSGAPDCSLQMP